MKIEDIKHNYEACIAAGPICVSLGGVPHNNHHIEYWKKRALKAETECDRLRRTAGEPSPQVHEEVRQDD